MLKFFNVLNTNDYYISSRKFSTSSKRILHSQLPKDSNITRIRVWRSGYFKDDSKTNNQTTFVHTSAGRAIVAPLLKNAQSNIGHVSIETEAVYASLWPNDPLTSFNKLKPMPGMLHSFTDGPLLDEQYEARPPDILVDLHTLEIKNIKSKLSEFKEFGANYHIFGRNHYLNNLGTNNCSGLAYDLLVHAGIKELIYNEHFVLDNIIVTPNNLARLILEAHHHEIKLQNRKHKPKPN